MSTYQEYNPFPHSLPYAAADPITLGTNEFRQRHALDLVTDLLQTHPEIDWTPDSAADRLYLSRNYLCRVIRDYCGCTFAEYLDYLRIEQAKTLLSQTELSVSAIACTVGFVGRAQFRRIFHKQCLQSPLSYRRIRTVYTD